MTDEQLPQSVVLPPIPYDRIIARLEPVDNDEMLIDLVVAGPSPQINVDHDHATLVLVIDSVEEARSVCNQLMFMAGELFSIAKRWETENGR